jgi:hypothetical protein
VATVCADTCAVIHNIVNIRTRRLNIGLPLTCKVA